ncbi:MAG: HAMP domain-containing histidine kinase [Bryobacterales bacterium]|nr:HAMP domain-containing histidine kinase [Bryobacterales bacterium]
MAQATIDPIPSQSDLQRAAQPLDTAAVVRHLAHELRQPLSTIEASAYYLKLILEEQDCGALRQLDRIEQMVHQMSWILSDAVHYLQAAEPRRQLLDLAETASTAIASLTQEQQVHLDWSDAEPAPLVAMDPNQAQHMVRSVLQVFRQIGRSEAPVTIVLRSDNNCALLTFFCEASDDVRQQCDDLLLPFDTHLPVGAGLGLASVKRIAEAHGGAVRIFPQQENLTLEIRLPSAS